MQSDEVFNDVAILKLCSFSSRQWFMAHAQRGDTGASRNEFLIRVISGHNFWRVRAPVWRLRLITLFLWFVEVLLWSLKQNLKNLACFGALLFLAAAWDHSHLWGKEKSVCQYNADNLPSPPTLSESLDWILWKESSARGSGFGVDLWQQRFGFSLQHEVGAQPRSELTCTF